MYFTSCFGKFLQNIPTYSVFHIVMLRPRPEVLKVNNMAEFFVDLVNSRLDAGSGQSSWAL